MAKTQRDLDFEAEMDASTLGEAATIRADRGRLAERRRPRASWPRMQTRGPRV